MPATLWLDSSGRLIIDADGKPILCAECPCDSLCDCADTYIVSVPGGSIDYGCQYFYDSEPYYVHYTLSWESFDIEVRRFDCQLDPNGWSHFAEPPRKMTLRTRVWFSTEGCIGTPDGDGTQTGLGAWVTIIRDPETGTCRMSVSMEGSFYFFFVCEKTTDCPPNTYAPTCPIPGSTIEAGDVVVS